MDGEVVNLREIKTKTINKEKRNKVSKFFIQFLKYSVTIAILKVALLFAIATIKGIAILISKIASWTFNITITPVDICIKYLITVSIASFVWTLFESIRKK